MSHEVYKATMAPPENCRTDMPTRPCPPKPEEPPVNLALIRLSAEVETNGELVEELYKKLQPILQSTPEEPSPKRLNDNTGSSPVVMAIVTLTGHAQDTNAGLNNILRRLEV